MSKKHSKKKSKIMPPEAPAVELEMTEEAPEMTEEELVEPEAYAEIDEPAQPPHEERHRKLTALWLAVGGSMAVIVALWLILLPVQIGDLRLPNIKDLSRWRAVTPATNATVSFDSALTQIKSRLEVLTNSSPPSAATKAKTLINIDALRQKLEAAAQRNEAAAPGANTNEVKE